MANCKSSQDCAEVVQLLLEAGADPTLAQENGITPLYCVAPNGAIDVVDMLYTTDLATLNRCAAEGTTPLFIACSEVHESIVSKLLSLGAMNRIPADVGDTFSVVKTVWLGLVGVFRVLINGGGKRAV